MPNADQIIPEFQHLEVGDKVAMHPTNGSPYVTAVIKSCRTLVLQLRVDTQTGKTFGLADPLPDQYHKGSWVFVLEELDEATTRLISRSRNEISAGFGTRLFYGFIGSVSIIMDWKMLLGIKHKAEGGSSQQVGTDSVRRLEEDNISMENKSKINAMIFNATGWLELKFCTSA